MTEITLTRGGVALCDAADLEMLIQHRWSAVKIHKRTYAVTNVNGKTTYMHRLVMPDAPEVDHRNRDGLDNRRENLRSCTHSQNLANAEFNRARSGFFSYVAYEHTGKFVEAEGLIGRPAVQLFDRRGERIQVKIKARDYR